MTPYEQINTPADQVAADTKNLADYLIRGTNNNIRVADLTTKRIRVGLSSESVLHLRNQIMDATVQLKGAQIGADKILDRYDRHLEVSGDPSQFGTFSVAPNITTAVGEDGVEITTASVSGKVTNIEFESGSLTLGTPDGPRDVAFAEIPAATNAEIRVARFVVCLELPESFDRLIR